MILLVWFLEIKTLITKIKNSIEDLEDKVEDNSQK